MSVAWDLVTACAARTAQRRCEAIEASEPQSTSWTVPSRFEHCSYHHAGDVEDFIAGLGPNRLMLRMSAHRLKLEDGLALPVEALERDLVADPRDHQVAFLRLGVTADRDVVAAGEPGAIE